MLPFICPPLFFVPIPIFLCSRCLIVGSFTIVSLAFFTCICFGALAAHGTGSFEDVTLPAFLGSAAPLRFHSTNLAGHFYRSPSFILNRAIASFIVASFIVAYDFRIRIFTYFSLIRSFASSPWVRLLSSFPSLTSNTSPPPYFSFTDQLHLQAASRSASISPGTRSTSSSDALIAIATTTHPTGRERHPLLQRNTSPCLVPSSRFLLHLFLFYRHLLLPLSYLHRCRRHPRPYLSSLPCVAQRPSRNSLKSSPSARMRRRRRRKRRRRRRPRAGHPAQAPPATPAAAAAATTAIATMSWTATTTTTIGTSKRRATEKSTSRGRGTSRTPYQSLSPRILTTHTAMSTLRAAPDEVRHLCPLRRPHHRGAMPTRIGSTILFA
ncbi:hypothetical protein GGI43DRAFT_37663 [Trichoderma evansii]